MNLDNAAAPRCNIGPDELDRRRRSAIVATIVAAIAAAAMAGLAVPMPIRLLLFPLATAAAITWLQVLHRFCVAFGALGLENFGRVGQQVEVDPRLRADDRRRALQLILEGTLVGLVATLALVAIPV